MIKSINIWSFPDTMEFSKCLEIAKSAGFEGFEPALDEKGPLNLNSTEDEILKVKSEVENAGLKISSLATTLYWKYPLTSDDINIRKKAFEIAVKQIDTASILGTDTILVVPGAVGVDFIPGFNVVDYDIVYDRALSAIKELAVYAEKKKIYIGIENVGNKFLLSPLEMRNFIDATGSPYVGSYFDVGNIIKVGYPEQWIKILGKRIKRIHFKDYRREQGGTGSFVSMLEGSVNYIRVMEELAKINYDSFVSAEVTPYNLYPEHQIYITSQAMDRIFGRI